MKLLLDTNIWSYVADTNTMPKLLVAARKTRTKFLIAPGSIDEARSMPIPALRIKLLELMTNKAWKRLMPEVFLECQEIKEALLAARPGWGNENPLVDNAYQRGRHYFLRSKGGFWDLAKVDAPLPVSDESLRADREHALARQEVRDIRDRYKERNQNGAFKRFEDVKLEVQNRIVGKREVQYWRVSSAYNLEQELQVFASPYREFLDCFIDIDAMFSDPDDFERVWYDEVQPEQLKRQWLRTAMEYQQRWQKPTDGSPGDSRLATHLIDADYFVTADKNFAKCLDKVHTEAPFGTGKPMMVSGGITGIEELLQFAERGPSK